MAMKQTTTFEDVPPAYFLSQDVEEVGRQVIADNVGFRDLDELRLAFAVRTDSPYSEEDGIDDVVGVSVENAMRRCLGLYDVIVWVKEAYWGRNPDLHEALLTHALSHVMVNEDGKVKKVGHDVEAFHREAVKFGAWRPQLSRFWTAMQADRDAPATPDPTKVTELANRAKDAREGRAE